VDGEPDGSGALDAHPDLKVGVVVGEWRSAELAGPGAEDGQNPLEALREFDRPARFLCLVE
jgi:hypothetical protein